MRRRSQRTDQQVIDQFYRLVNMTSEELGNWLATEESKMVGFTYPGARESVGRQSARKIARILDHGAGYGDIAHMRKVVGYIKRHLAQRPGGGARYTRWRYSLMNWGHDPLNRGSL